MVMINYVDIQSTSLITLIGDTNDGRYWLPNIEFTKSCSGSNRLAVKYQSSRMVWYGMLWYGMMQ